VRIASIAIREITFLLNPFLSYIIPIMYAMNRPNNTKAGFSINIAVRYVPRKRKRYEILFVFWYFINR